jgi:hypothetical protein
MATTLLDPRRTTTLSRPNGVLAAVLAHIASWRYAGERRDLRFDLLRGLAVIAMVTDHIGGERSWLYSITGGNHFWTSAAEEFVFISGLVMGIVYPAMIAKQGLQAALLKVLKRSGTLYALTVILTLTTAALAYHLQVHWAPQVNANTLPDFVIGVLTLHRAYYLTDVLLMYTLLVFAAAGAIFLLCEGYTRLVLGISWGLWLTWQIWPQQAAIPWAITDNSVFNLAAWQVLFFTGLVIGYHRKALAKRCGWFTGKLSLLISGALFVGMLSVYRAGLEPLVRLTGRDAAWLNTHLFSKSDEQIGRLLAFAVFATFVLALVTNFWRPITRVLGWLLLPLGQQALWAYGLHLFVIMLTTKAGTALFDADTLSIGQNTFLQIAGILLIWGMIIVRQRLLGYLRAARPAETPVVLAPQRVTVERARSRG